MKQVILFLTLIGLSFSSYAEQNIEEEINQQPIEIRIAIMAMKSCMEQYIEPARLQGIEQRVDHAVKRIEGYCRNNDEAKAYHAVVGYSKQPETKAFLACVSQLKPLVESPSVQKLIGNHRNDVNIVLAGGIPQPICR